MESKQSKPQQRSHDIIGGHYCMKGCLHEADLTHEQFSQALVEERFNAETMSYDKFITCPGCSADFPRKGDFCMNSMVHEAILSYPLVRGHQQQSEQQQQ